MTQETWPVESRKRTDASKLKVGDKCEGAWAWEPDRTVVAIDDGIVTFDNGFTLNSNTQGQKVTKITVRQSRTRPAWEDFR